MSKIKTEANFRNRIPATIIDYTLFYAFFFIYAYVFGEPDEEGGHTVRGFATLVVPFVWFLYFPVVESIGGQTLGHKIMGIKVVSKSGKPIDLSQAVRRRLADMIDLQFFFGLIGYLVVRNSPDHQRLGDMWAGTIVVGGTREYCQNCRESLVLSAKEHVAGKYECPECGTPNFTQQQNPANISLSVNKQINQILSSLPEIYLKHQQIIIARNYLDHSEWVLALESIIEMTQKTGHLFSQDFWLELKDIAQLLNQGKTAEYCHAQMLHTTREFKGVLEKGNTAERLEDGSFTHHEVKK